MVFFFCHLIASQFFIIMSLDLKLAFKNTLFPLKDGSLQLLVFHAPALINSIPVFSTQRFFFFKLYRVRNAIFSSKYFLIKS